MIKSPFGCKHYEMFLMLVHFFPAHVQINRLLYFSTDVSSFPSGRIHEQEPAG